MDFLSIKHIFSFLTLAMVIYALLFDFKKELRNKEGFVVKKSLNKYGWINIIMLSIIGLGTLIFSISEDIQVDKNYILSLIL